MSHPEIWFCRACGRFKGQRAPDFSYEVGVRFPPFPPLFSACFPSSAVLISQLPTEQWYSSIGDNTPADAILDRLMHNAHRLNLKGESMRKKQADLTNVNT